MLTLLHEHCHEQTASYCLPSLLPLLLLLLLLLLLSC
jgi:hypothetical protein